jgi:hypothetical protein
MLTKKASVNCSRIILPPDLSNGGFPAAINGLNAAKEVFAAQQ